MQAGEAGPARTAAQLQQERRRVACRILLGGLVAAGLVRTQQGIQPFARRRRQSLVNAEVETILVGAQRRAGDPLYSIDRRWFDRQLAAARFQALDHRRNLATYLPGNVIAQPARQPVGIGDRSLAESKAHANFGAQALGGAAREEGFSVHRCGSVELLAQRRDALRLDFALIAREATPLAEEGQQNGKAQPVRPVLGHHQLAFGRCQQPPIVCATAVRHVVTRLGQESVLRYWYTVSRLIPNSRASCALFSPAAARCCSSATCSCASAFLRPR